jgi:two-component sensor histidine kinase
MPLNLDEPEGAVRSGAAQTRPIQRDELAGSPAAFERLEGINEALRATNTSNQRVLDASIDCIQVLDLEAGLLSMSEPGKIAMEVDDFEAIRGWDWRKFWSGEAAVTAAKALDVARAGGTGRFRAFSPTLRGTPKWWEVVVTAIPGLDGMPERLLSVSRDITYQRASEARQRMLMRELQHRVKNTLAMVQGVVSQTLRTATDLKEARHILEERIGALARAHDLLTQESWVGAGFAELAESAFRPYGDKRLGRLTLAGPDIELGPAAALALGLAINELCTNATKYGALSNDAGSVSLTWSVEGDVFAMTWRETGGPPVSAAQKRGFGSLLIEQNLGRQFGGPVKLIFDPAGLVCTATGSLKAMQDETD